MKDDWKSYQRELENYSKNKCKDIVHRLDVSEYIKNIQASINDMETVCACDGDWEILMEYEKWLEDQN